MTTRATRDYRRDMASIHEHVATTGEEVVITRGGRPYVKVVPATRESIFDRLEAEGRLTRPSEPRRPVTPIDAGGHDTTEIIAEMRR